MRKIFVLGLAVGLPLVMTPFAAGAEQRQLGTHEHGRGTLQLAIEDGKLSLEFEAPGADIVGFESVAKTPRQKAAVEDAKKRLLAPQTLFKFPRAAGCVVAAANVDIEREHEDHDGAAAKETPPKANEGHEDGEHSSFHGEYQFTCNAPANITAVDFGYFQAFPGAQKLEVTVITAKGQTKFDVTRSKPRIDLAGMM
ncbi:MAG TPA: DUF2796 domain-containing protein [Hyphomicrobiaceae bacterium]|nr:DUF2796 domain-containing protein [Hyphomicrobiaceae bacterium]